MLRTLFFYLAFLPATIIFSLWAIIRPSDCDTIMRIWGGFSMWAAGVRIDADIATLEPGRTYVFMANHQSNFDILILGLVLKNHNIRFVAKESLFALPFLGWAMRRVGHIGIDRANPKKAMKSIDAAACALRDRGVSIVIFPEGTRAREYDRLQEFQVGGFILALKCDAPVVPILIRGSGSIMPRQSPFIRPGRVTVKALAPIDAKASYGLKQRETFRADLYALMNATYVEPDNG